MKHIYRFLAVVAMALAFAPGMVAAEWSYDWPNSATAEKDAGYPGGFYNFGTAAFDGDITSIERTLNGRVWKLSFDAGTKLAYTSGSGQAVGSSGGFSSYFSLASSAFSGKIKSVTVSTRTKVADAKLTVSVSGKAYECGGATEVAYTTGGTTPLEYVFVPGSDGEQEGEIMLYFTLPGASGNAFVKALKVEYEEVVSNVETPVFSPAAGSFDEPVSVTISGPADAEIYYTTDGSNPRADGNAAVVPYTGAIEVAQTTTLKAAAKVGDEFSNVAEARYVIRQSPELKFSDASLEIELLEEGFSYLENPHNVSPITYRSSVPSVAWADEYGLIYTYSVGETEISAVFAGDDTYFPQTVTLPVTVVAKEPLAGLTVSPGEGVYNTLTEVKVSCTDPRAAALWYYIGDEAMDVDELGILNEYTIHPSTEMTLTLDESCVLTVQAMGTNVWSLPQTVSYTINLPLEAKFEGGDQFETVYYNGFDSEDDFNAWSNSTGSGWQLGATPQDGTSVPAFSSINADSKSSLYHYYMGKDDTSVITSPDITVPENARVRFYAVFDPVWIYYSNLQLYVCENVDGATPVKIWDAFLASQEAATDDAKWTQYTADLAEYAGKEVYFAFAYEMDNGSDVLVDDFEVVVPGSTDSSIKVGVGEKVPFRDLSTGHPDAWAWEFPGATPATSSEQNPVVVYEKPGTYDVSLTVSKGGESRAVKRAQYVVVHSVAPTAGIGIPDGVYYSPEAGLVVPLNTPLTFTDASKGSPDTFEWTLPGTDTQTSDAESVTVKYLQEGVYDVDLTVSNDAGSSSTYIYGVKAGGESLAWNISAADNDKLEAKAMGWYGYYGGTNWLDMDAFAEAFAAPAVPVLISSVNVYFASVTTVSPSDEITVSIALPDAEGLPGETVASTKLMVSQLVDASETYNDPTEFVFDTPARVEGAFFVTISGFPNQSDYDGEDAVAMYVLSRDLSDRGTTYHLLKEMDDYYQPTGEVKWYAQVDDPCSFAIAPKITFDNPSSAIRNVDAAAMDETAPVIYYNLQGIRVDAENLAPGIYIRRQGATSTKIRM